MFTINRIRELVGTRQQGTTLLGLKRGAETLGFQARSVKAPPEICDRIKEVPNEFLPPISRWSTLGGLFIVGSVGVAIALASVIKYNVTVKASATVRPADELRLVQASHQRRSGEAHLRQRESNGEKRRCNCHYRR
nr:cysteine peptidase family C39 domain-containing protein [Coleofasciculus sp. LEGE 07081]